MSVIEIRLAGVDITDDVLLGSAEFTAQANGYPGTARFAVRDTFDTMTFLAGALLELYIDGTRQWDGWSLTLRRSYFASVWPTRAVCEGLVLVPRMFIIEGVDRNMLFSRRVAYDHDDPTRLDFGSVAGTTTDRAAIQLLMPYFDIDEIDTDTKVDVVGTVSYIADLRTNLGAASWTLGETLAGIAKVPAAIYYIDPDRYLVYADVDGLSTSDVYTDHPTGVNDVGVREFEVMNDGSKMDNDHMTWGTALGVDNVRFARSTDSTSIGLHGRWQGGDRITLYHQSYIQARADSFVYGSPQSKRGGKDDRVSAKFSLFNHPIRVADRPTVESEVHGFSDVIPVRQLRISFPTKSDVRYDVVVSHEIDLPFAFFETRWLIDEPGAGGGDGGDPPPYIPGDPTFGLILDSFSRDIEYVIANNQYVVPGEWGTGEYLTWERNVWSSPDARVDSGYGIQEAILNQVAPTGGVDYGDHGMTAQIPSTVAPIYRHNLLVKFRFGRKLRVYHDGGTSTVGPLPALIGGLQNPGGAWDQDAYGNPDYTTYEYFDPSVALSAGSVVHTMTPIIPADMPITSETRTVFQGPLEDMGGYEMFQRGGGGMLNWVQTYFSNGAYWRPGVQSQIVFSQSLLPLQYFGGWRVWNYFFVSDDVPGMDYPWRIYARMRLSYVTVEFIRNNLPTADGEPFAIRVTHQDIGPGFDFTTGGTGAMVIEPDTDYWVRVYRPVGTNITYFSIWRAGAAEPPPFITLQYWRANGEPYTYGTGGNNAIQMFAQAYDMQSYTLEVDIIAAAPAGSGWGSGLPGTGALVCENAILADGHVWTVTETIVEVESVKVDGIEQARGTIWYVYEALPNAVFIVPTVNAGAVVTVCYYPLTYVIPAPTQPGKFDPDLTGPVYRPAFVSQFGWGSTYDGVNCTAAAGCMALDRHTRGVKTTNPPVLRSYQTDTVGGIDLNDVDTAFHVGFDENLEVATTSWATFAAEVDSGRGAILQGIYGELGSYSLQTSFTGPHAMYVNERREDGDWLVSDPIGTSPDEGTQWIPDAVLRDYAETFGAGSVFCAFTATVI